MHSTHEQHACIGRIASTASVAAPMTTLQMMQQAFFDRWAVPCSASVGGDVPVACFACVAGAAHASRLPLLTHPHHWGGRTQTKCSSLA